MRVGLHAKLEPAGLRRLDQRAAQAHRTHHEVQVGAERRLAGAACPGPRSGVLVRRRQRERALAVAGDAPQRDPLGERMAHPGVEPGQGRGHGAAPGLGGVAAVADAVAEDEPQRGALPAPVRAEERARHLAVEGEVALAPVEARHRAPAPQRVVAGPFFPAAREGEGRAQQQLALAHALLKLAPALLVRVLRPAGSEASASSEAGPPAPRPGPASSEARSGPAPPGPGSAPFSQAARLRAAAAASASRASSPASPASRTVAPSRAALSSATGWPPRVSSAPAARGASMRASTASSTWSATVRPKRASHAFCAGSAFSMVPVASPSATVAPERVREPERHRLRALVMGVVEHRDPHRLRRLPGPRR